MNTRALGTYGEKLAIKYLKKQGYLIRDINIVSHAGEVDIVAEDQDIIVFVEVKTRTDEEFGRPSEAINHFKIRRYIKSAKLYINANRLANRDIRFDVIEIINDEIVHIKDAFRA